MFSRTPPYTHRSHPSIHPATHPNSILIRNNHDFLTKSWASNSLQTQTQYSKAPVSSGSFDYPPGFPKPVCLRTQPQHFKDLGSPGSYDYPPGFTPPRKLTICITNVSRKTANGEVIKCCSVFGKVNSFKRFNSLRGTEVSHCLIKYQRHEQAAKAITRLGGTRRFFKSWRAKWAREELSNEVPTKEKDIEEGEFSSEIAGVENEGVHDFLKYSWMIVMETQRSIQNLRNILNGIGVQATSLIRWGLYGIIAVCNSQEDMAMWQQKKQELLKIFIQVHQFETCKNRVSRYCWIDCSGIPIGAWSLGTMKNIAAKWGKLLAVDKETELMHRVDVAKLFVEVTQLESIKALTSMTFKMESYNLGVREVDRDENVEFLATQDSCLGLPFSSPEKSSGSFIGILMNNNIVHEPTEKLEAALQDVDLGGDEVDQNCVIGLHASQTAALCTKEKENTELAQFQTQPNLTHSNGSTNALSTEGYNTVVPQTNSSHMSLVQETPIIFSKILEGGEKSGGNKSCKVKNCVGCDNYKKKKEKQEEEAAGVSELPSIEMEKEAIPSDSTSKKSKNANKKCLRTPLRLGPRGVLEGRIVKKTSRKKEKQQSKAKVQENENSARPNKSSQRKSNRNLGFGMDTGLRILDEIGVKLSTTSARRLKLNELFHDNKAVDLHDKQGEGTSNTPVHN